MLNSKVTIGNITDAEAFVRHCINKSRLPLTVDERDELVAEGLVLVCELHLRYDPKRLPRKLNDAWHRSQPHHLLRTQPDGTRRYEYVKTAKSLDDVHLNGMAGERNEDGTRLDQLHAGNCRTTGDYVAVPLQKAA
jgi:hypothetical protein